METVVHTDRTIVEGGMSAASWASIAAGAVATAALTLALLALGAGLGLSSISPWADSGVSAATFKTATGIYLVLVAVMSSAIGGYLAARLRTKWVGFEPDEVFFRDTAHGFIAWAFATVISAAALGAATTHILGGAAAGIGAAAGQAAASVNPYQATAVTRGQFIGQQPNLRLAWAFAPHFSYGLDLAYQFEGAALKAAGAKDTLYIRNQIAFDF